MELPGHVGAALLAYAPVALVATVLWSPRLAIVGAVVTVALASVPDGDHYVPRLVHRGYVHTVWFALAVGVGCSATIVTAGVGRVAVPAAVLGAFGFVVGTTAILSHLAADALTPMGVAPFAPVIRRRYSLGVTRSADRRANRRLLLAGVVAAVLAFGLGWLASIAW